MSTEGQFDPGRDPVPALAETIARARSSVLYAERLRGLQLRSLEDLRNVPITTRADLQRAGPHGTRAVPLEEVCHYGETSGTTGASNSTWLTARDFRKNAERIVKGLAGHERIARIHYPALFTDPDQKRCYEAQCDYAGGIFSIDLEGGKRSAFEFLRRLRITHNAVSLGGMENPL